MSDQRKAREILGVNSEVFRWLMFEDGLPGTLGPAVAFSGVDSSKGRVARLQRHEDKWQLQIEGEEARGVDVAVIGEMIATKKFLPQTVVTIPNLAPKLFRLAVERAEESVRLYTEALGSLKELRRSGNEGDKLIQFVLHTSNLDKVVRSAIAAEVFGAAAAEAQLNSWADDAGGWKREGRVDEDRLSVVKKCAVLARRVGVEMNLDEEPWKGLEASVKRRNAMMHAKPTEEEFPLFGAQAPIPGYAHSVAARKACLSVRLALVELAHVLGLAAPRYLAYCPDIEADDDKTWLSAVVMTGAREDAVFPRIGSISGSGSVAEKDPS